MQSPDWSTLDHAYGSAGDIPALLERARHAGAPRAYRDEPWFSLWSALCHQGDVFTASYAAVIELVAIAEHRRAEVRASAECLHMAAIIELERAAPEGASSPPGIPLTLDPDYHAALVRGAELAAELLATAEEPQARAMLWICVAAFGGDVERARMLADGA